jgi:EpsI family protein
MGSTHLRLITLIVILAITFAEVQAATRRRASQVRLPDWSAVRYEFDGWAGTDAAFDPIYGPDPAQTSVLRIYQQPATIPVIAYIGYYDDIAKILEVHTPERCYPGQGWKIISTGESKAALFRGRSIPAKEIMVEKEGSRRLVLWWYTAGSRPFETRIRYIYALLAMSTLTGRSDGSLIRLETPFTAGGEVAAMERIERFQRGFLSQIDKALPR